MSYKGKPKNQNVKAGTKTANRNKSNMKVGAGASSRRTDGSVGVASAYSKSQQTKPARVSQSKGSRRIQHRELVGSINGSVAFAATGYACNPGNSSVFPWLSVQAAQYEQYTFHKLKFEYITRTASTTVGSVLLAPDYDPTDPAPVTEAALSAYEDCVEDVPWRDQCCIFNPKAMFPSGPRKFLRSSNVAGDLKLYDAAKFYVGTVDEAGTTAIGKLWVEYDVEFFVPQTTASSAGGERSSFYERSATDAFVSGAAHNMDFDAASNDSLGIGPTVTGFFTPPKGAYIVTACVSFADNTAEAFTASLSLEKNASLITTGNTAVSSNTGATGGGANQTVSLTAQGYIVCNGTDTISVRPTLTGAAGTLTSTAQGASILFVMA